MIDAHKIVYNNLSSEEFGVTLHLAFDSENGASNSFLNREAISTEVYDGSRKFIHGSKYTDSATPRFTLMKNDCGDFNAVENRRILSWLTGNSKPSWLEVYQDDSNVISYRYFCVITTVEQYKLSNGRVVGYEFEIFSDAPYAWSRQFIYPDNHMSNDENKDYLTVYGTQNFKITCNTDDYNKLIYPKVIINFDKSKDIYIPISNDDLTDDKHMFPNTVYVNNEKYYVNIAVDDLKVRAEVKPISGNTPPSQDLLGQNPSNYFYDEESHVIKSIVGVEGSEKWNIIVKVGAAIQIKTSYTFGGETVEKETTVKNVVPGEQVILDGTNKVVSVIWYDEKGNKIDDVRIMGDDFNWVWLPLAYGDNDISITGNCDVQIQWIEPCKVGSL